MNYYESFLAATGVVSPAQRNTTSSWTNEAILKMRNSWYSQVRQWADKLWDSNNFNGMDIHNYKRYTANNEGADYAAFLQQNKFQLGVEDNVNFVEFNQAINTAFSEDMFQSYQSGLNVLLKAGKRTLIYVGQNDYITNPAGIFTCLQDAEWPGARDWRETKK